MSKSSISILAKAIANSKGLTEAEAERFITQMFSVANGAIQDEKQLKVKWLGTFKVTAVKDRESVDVNTGERIVIEGRDKISFTPDNILKEIVNKPFAQFETVVVNDGVDFSDIDEKFAQIEMDTAEDSQKVGEFIEDSLKVSGPLADRPADANTSDIATSDSLENSTEKLSETISETQQMDSEVGIGDSENTSEGELMVEQILESVPESAIEHVVESTSRAVETESKVQSAQIVEDEVDESEKIEMIENKPSAGDIAVGAEDSEKVIMQKAEEAVGMQKTTDAEEGNEDLEDEESSKKHHFVIPKYVAVVACIVFVGMLGAVCWFAYNYGMMQAQQKNLQVQLADLKANSRKAAAAQAARRKAVVLDSAQLALREKARQDSLRMAAANNAINMAEKADSLRKAQEKQAAKDAQNIQGKSLADKTKQELNAKQSNAKLESNAKQSDEKLSQVRYDDPRVRTGAYRIVGVAQTITVHEGQTLQGITRRYLGSGMECYVEALNGCKEVKAGQKLKIPKVELKKKSK